MSRATVVLLLLALPAPLAVPSVVAQLAPRPGDVSFRPAVVTAGSGAAEFDAVSPGTQEPVVHAWDQSDTYRTGEAMVRAPGALAEVAAAVGGRVLRPEGRSGWGAVAWDGSTTELIARLDADPRVEARLPHAWFRGAAKGGYLVMAGDQTEPVQAGESCDGGVEMSDYPPDRALPAQWHLDGVQASAPGVFDYDDFPVAILDSGVAYAHHDDGSLTYVPAPSLSASPIVAPWDFVNDDALPLDDHQHGTHIATTIAGWGAVEGVTPGVPMMPIKVLDHENRGMEIDLVEGLHHALLHGAAVVNMSVSFPEGYVPSTALVAIIDMLFSERRVLVAAAGNDGAAFVTYPAAHPLVIAVGASRLAEGDEAKTEMSPDYANRAPGVDVLAPGGDLGRDVDGDGMPDGILAETIHPGDPSRIALWLYAGSSQAAAIASGMAVQALHAGVPAIEVAGAMQMGAFLQDGEHDFVEGQGAGIAKIGTSHEAACDGKDPLRMVVRYHGSVLPYMVREAGGMVVPTALITAIDDRGSIPIGDAVVTMAGTTAETLSCVLGTQGTCKVYGEPISAFDEDGELRELAWSFSLDAVVTMGVAHRATPAVFATDALEVMLTALEDAGAPTDAVLAVSWRSVYDPELGRLVPGFAVMNSGTGFATSPLGIVFHRRALRSGLTETTRSVDLDGTGFATSPLGRERFRFVQLTGTGLTTSPLGSKGLKLIALDGTGFATSPLGLRAVNVFSRRGGGRDFEGLSFDGDPVLMGEGVMVGASMEGTALERRVASGGWATDSGYGAASALAGSGELNLLAPAVAPVPIGDGSEAFAGDLPGPPVEEPAADDPAPPDDGFGGEEPPRDDPAEPAR